MLLPLQGAECRCLIPGVPLRSAPGYVLVAFSRRIHPISGRLCSLILLTNLSKITYITYQYNLYYFIKRWYLSESQDKGAKLMAERIKASIKSPKI